MRPTCDPASSAASTLAPAPELSPSSTMLGTPTPSKHADASNKVVGEQHTPDLKKGGIGGSNNNNNNNNTHNSLPTPQSLETTRGSSTRMISISTPSRPPADAGFNRYSEMSLQTPELGGKARRDSSQISPGELQGGPYESDESCEGISPGQLVQGHRSVNPIGTSQQPGPGLLQRTPTTHPLYLAPQPSMPPAAAPPSPSDTTFSQSWGSEDETISSKQGMHTLPVAHRYVTRIVDPAAPIVRLVHRLAFRLGTPWIPEPTPSGPRPLPDHLMSSSYMSFRSVPNSAGIYVPPATRFDENGLIPKTAQVPAVRVYSADYARSLKGEYAFDHGVASIHFRLRYSGIPYADCPAICFLAPNWQFLYVWSAYPFHVERYPFWFLRQPRHTLETRFVQGRMKEYGHIGAGEERNYRSWDFLATRGLAWGAGGRDASLDAFVRKGMVPDLNSDLICNEKAKDMAAIEIVGKLNWFVTYERQGQFFLGLILSPAPLPFYAITFLPHLFLIPMFVCRWVITWAMLLVHGILSMDPWTRWKQQIDIIDTLGGMVNHGLEITASRAKQEHQFLREEQRRQEELRRIRAQVSHQKPGGANAPPSPSLASDDASGPCLKPTSWLSEEEWINGSLASLGTSMESLCSTDNSINEHAGPAGCESHNKEQFGFAGPWWILGGKQPTDADFVVYGFLATMLATPTQPRIAHLLRSSPVLVIYMSRIHEMYFPDFPPPGLAPNPASSLTANMVYHFSRSGFKSCIKHAISHIIDHFDPFSLVSATQPEPRTNQASQFQPDVQSGSQLMPTIPVQRMATPVPPVPPVPSTGLAPTPAARPDDISPSQYLEYAKETFSRIMFTLFNYVPIIDTSLSVRSRASQANILEISTEDSLLIPLGNGRRRFSLLTPSDTLHSGMMEHPDMSRFGSFSQPQVLPGGGRIVAPGELPPSPPLAFPETPVDRIDNVPPQVALDQETPTTVIDRVPTSAAVGQVGAFTLPTSSSNSHPQPLPPTPININNRTLRMTSVTQDTPTKLPPRRSSIQFIEPQVTRRSSIAVAAALHKSDIKNTDASKIFPSPAVKVGSCTTVDVCEDSDESPLGVYPRRRRSSTGLPVTIEEEEDPE